MAFDPVNWKNCREKHLACVATIVLLYSIFVVCLDSITNDEVSFSIEFAITFVAKTLVYMPVVLLQLVCMIVFWLGNLIHLCVVTILLLIMYPIILAPALCFLICKYA